MNAMANSVGDKESEIFKNIETQISGLGFVAKLNIETKEMLLKHQKRFGYTCPKKIMDNLPRYCISIMSANNPKPFAALYCNGMKEFINLAKTGLSEKSILKIMKWEKEIRRKHESIGID